MELMNNATSKDGLSPPVSHKGTFNASPLIAAAACAAMPLLASGEAQQQADAMAKLMRDGMNAVFSRLNVAGFAYGESSIFHVHFGRADLSGLTPAQIRGLPAAQIKAYRDGLLKRGVDMMAYTSGLTSIAHTPALIDEALVAFEQTIAEMKSEGLFE
jgi:glutamate-1-semialdehyde 2,1-aminomutase